MTNDVMSYVVMTSVFMSIVVMTNTVAGVAGVEVQMIYWSRV